MKKYFSLILVPAIFLLAGCTAQAPMTEEEQAAQYGLTVERYREEKAAAARMNMSWEEHVKMIQMDNHSGHEGMDHMNH